MSDSGARDEELRNLAERALSIKPLFPDPGLSHEVAASTSRSHGQAGAGGPSASTGEQRYDCYSLRNFSVFRLTNPENGHCEPVGPEEHDFALAAIAANLSISILRTQRGIDALVSVGMAALGEAEVTQSLREATSMFLHKCRKGFPLLQIATMGDVFARTRRVPWSGGSRAYLPRDAAIIQINKEFLDTNETMRDRSQTLFDKYSEVAREALVHLGVAIARELVHVYIGYLNAGTGRAYTPPTVGNVPLGLSKEHLLWSEDGDPESRGGNAGRLWEWIALDTGLVCWDEWVLCDEDTGSEERWCGIFLVKADGKQRRITHTLCLKILADQETFDLGLLESDAEKPGPEPCWNWRDERWDEANEATVLPEDCEDPATISNLGALAPKYNLSGQRIYSMPFAGSLEGLGA